jgi:hypothetical protein
MRVTDDRYRRDLRRHDLALRMIRHEARTQTICAWTALSDERVRNLYHSYSADSGGAGVARHRGPSPYRLANFLRSPSMRSEAAVMAGMCRLFEVIPGQRMVNARRELPSVPRGERVCSTYELFQRLVTESQMTLDLLILLVTALAQGDELAIDHCDHCGSVILIDRLGLTRRICTHCNKGGRRGVPGDVLSEALRSEEVDGGTLRPPAGELIPDPQRSLF